MITNEVVMEVCFILFMALSVGLGIAILAFLLLLIFPTKSYKERMKPLNEAVDEQRKQEKERREKELKRKLL